MPMTKQAHQLEIVHQQNPGKPIEIRITDTDGLITERVLLSIPEATQLIERIAATMAFDAAAGVVHA